MRKARLKISMVPPTRLISSVFDGVQERKFDMIVPRREELIQKLRLQECESFS